MEDIETFLEMRKKSGMLRSLENVSMRRQGRVTIGGVEYEDFSSNDYLGLSRHPRIIEAAADALTRYGTGSSASRLMGGGFDIHHELEEKTAAFKDKEAALVFNSGYQANVGIMSALCGRGDAVFCDRLSHASIIDGILLSGARMFRFNHNDVSHLDDLLKRERPKFKKALIATETVFSMDGDLPDLKVLVDVKEKFGCGLFVDEAHATGIFGPDGAGIVSEYAVAENVEFIMGTFGKALGSFGSYLAASKKVIDYMVNMCRSFIYSTALPPPVIAANSVAIDIIKEEPHRRRELLESADFMRNGLKKGGFEARGSSQIIPVILGGTSETVEIARQLKGIGYWAKPVRPPTVPEGEARLRFSITYDHKRHTLQRLLDDISKFKIQVRRQRL